MRVYTPDPVRLRRGSSLLFTDDRHERAVPDAFVGRMWRYVLKWALIDAMEERGSPPLTEEGWKEAMASIFELRQLRENHPEDHLGAALIRRLRAIFEDRLATVAAAREAGRADFPWGLADRDEIIAQLEAGPVSEPFSTMVREYVAAAERADIHHNWVVMYQHVRSSGGRTPESDAAEADSNHLFGIASDIADECIRRPAESMAELAVKALLIQQEADTDDEAQAILIADILRLARTETGGQDHD